MSYSLEIEGLVRRKQELEAEVDRLRADVVRLEGALMHSGNSTAEKQDEIWQLRAQVKRLKRLIPNYLGLYGALEGK